MKAVTRNLTDAEKLLIEVAISPPVYQSTWAHKAQISWLIIKQIRKHLDANHIDWKQIKKEYAQIIKEKQKAENYDYAAADFAFDAAREDRIFGKR